MLGLIGLRIHLLKFQSMRDSRWTGVSRVKILHLTTGNKITPINAKTFEQKINYGLIIIIKIGEVKADGEITIIMVGTVISGKATITLGLTLVIVIQAMEHGTITITIISKPIHGIVAITIIHKLIHGIVVQIINGAITIIIRNYIMHLKRYKKRIKRLAKIRTNRTIRQLVKDSIWRSVKFVIITNHLWSISLAIIWWCADLVSISIRINTKIEINFLAPSARQSDDILSLSCPFMLDVDRLWAIYAILNIKSHISDKLL